MPLHGPISNKKYVKRVVPFAKAKRHGSLSLIFDSRSGKELTDACVSEAKAWACIATRIRANGGLLIDHAGSKAIVRVPDSRRTRA